MVARSLNRLDFSSTLLRVACAVSLAGLAVILAACGGEPGGGGPSTGGLTLQAHWEHRPEVFTSEIPPSVSLVEVRVDGSGRSPVCRFVDPLQTRSVTISGLAIGPADVQILAYDIPAPAETAALNCNILPPPLNVADVPPSFKSAPVSVVIRQGRTADAGDVQVLAQPFVTDFVPVPGASDVDPSAPVSFLLGTAVNDISRASINIKVGGVDAVGAGASLTHCGSPGDTNCDPPDRQLSRQLVGFKFSYHSPPFDPNSTIEVTVSASDLDT
jgi:hypothetical protein